MSPTYDELQDQLIDWLRPMRSTITDLSPDEFDKSLVKKIEVIIPDDRALRLIVALSNLSLCITNEDEPYMDATDIIGDSIYRNLYGFAWQWYKETKKDMEELNA